VARCDSYTYGDCTWGMCEAVAWVRDGWNNAKDWWSRASRDGFQETLTPVAGAIVVFGAGNGYDAIFGHVAWVSNVFDATHFRVYEMNYAGWNVYDTRDTVYRDVVTFILPPGVPAPVYAPPVVPAVQPGLDGLLIAWSYTQHYFNTDIEDHVSRVQASASRLDALTRV
jgi:CHAP domain